MKRCSIDGSSDAVDGCPISPREEKKKRLRSAAGETDPYQADPVPEIGEDLVLEVLKRADARTVGRAACVCRIWRRLAEDDRLWEVVCTRDWVKLPYSELQLRSVVLALGGFRRLHSLYILPLMGHRPAAGSPSLFLPSSAASTSSVYRRPETRNGKDEVQLSLALLSLGFFGKLNSKDNQGRRR
ncbi:F-box protein GID2-like [Curcuma longa]|uniref:F-box protein GID2-like n=1 Tax=Curcuma longa TaxID=136217 RepID=UPI003D9DE01D